MKHRNLNSIERGINLVRKLKGLPRRTSLDRNSWEYRHEAAEVIELSIICDLWHLEKRFLEDTVKKVNVRVSHYKVMRDDAEYIDEWDLEDSGFRPDFTEAAYKIAFELDIGFFVSVYENDKERVDRIFNEWEWIDNLMDKVRDYRRATDYPAQNEKEAELLANFKPNQSKAAKAAVIVAADFPGMTLELALKIVKNSLI